MRLHRLILLAAFSLAGCGGQSWTTSIGPASPTDNLALDLELVDSDTSLYARYRVSTGGAITFWGGPDVVLDHVTWQGELTNEQGGELAGMIRDAGWLQSPPGGDGIGDRTWTIQLYGSGEHQDFTAHGDAASLDKVYKLLQGVSSQRFSSFIDELPQPSIKTLAPVDSKEQEQ